MLGSGAAGSEVPPGGRRLSESIRWSSLQAFYAGQGPDIWANGTVPHYVTNNPYFADACAEVVHAWLAEWWEELSARDGDADPEPFGIIELGAGSGRFAYLFLQALAARMGSGTGTEIPWRYVATDVSGHNRSFIRQHPNFRPYLEAGRFDTAHFTPNDGKLRLEWSGQSLEAGVSGAPLVIIANYVFDSLPQDCFTVRDGVLHESLLIDDTGDPAAARFRQVAAPWDYYGDPEFDGVLARYRQGPEVRSILFPLETLRWLRRIRELAGDRMLLLVSDKGYLPGAVGEEGPPSVESHGADCCSMVVNFDALAGYAVQAGGEAWFQPNETDGLLTAAYTFGAPGRGLDRARQAYENAFGRTSPMDVFHVADQAMRNPAAFELPALLALLRLSRHDPELFASCFYGLLNGARQAPEDLRRDAVRAARRVWRNVYPIGTSEPVALLCGAFVAELGDADDAEEMLRTAAAPPAENPAAMYLLGRLLARGQREEEGLQWMERALVTNADFEDYLCFMGILPHRESKVEVERLRWNASLRQAE